jgi:hypothetical protein
MRRDADTMKLRQPAADRDKRLHVAARADDHDHNGQAWHARGLELANRGCAHTVILQPPRQEGEANRVQETESPVLLRHRSLPAPPLR